MSAVLRLAGNGVDPGRALWLWCPGCDDAHRVTVDSSDSWTWDGNETVPTIEPSIKVIGHQWEPASNFYKPAHAAVHPGQMTVCHSFLRAGRWEFLTDSTHARAGQTAPMVALPDWLNDEYVQ